jgi:hypothetical protein
MKKTATGILFFFWLIQIQGQETRIEFTITPFSDTLLVNGFPQTYNDKIDLVSLQRNSVFFKVIADRTVNYSFRLDSGRHLVKAYTQMDFDRNKGVLRFDNLPLGQAYRVSLTTGEKVIKFIFFLKQNQNADNPTVTPEKTISSREPYLPKIAYYDALTLNSPGSLTRSEWDNIFRFYFNEPFLSHQDIIKRLKDTASNQFLAHSVETENIDKILKPDVKVPGAQSLLTGISSLSLASVGGLDVTNIADGFARFIVRRAKTELSIAFFDKFKSEISKPEYKDMQSLFPQTYRALSSIGDEIYNYESFIQTLRECFENDLANLVTNMPEIIANHEEFFNRKPELKAMLNSAFYIGKQLQDKQNPGTIIENYPDKDWKECDPDYRAVFQTIKIVSASLRNKDAYYGYWISGDDLKNLTDNDKAFRIYIGLLIEIAKKDSIAFGKNNEKRFLWEMMNSTYPAVKNDLSAYSVYFSEFINKTDVLGKKLDGLKQTGSDSLLLENYYGFFSSVFDLLKFTSEIETLPDFPKLNLKVRSGKYLDAAQTMADIVIDVNRRNYSSAVVNMYQLYTAVFSAKNVEKPLAVIKNEEEKTTQQYRMQLDSLKLYSQRLEKEKEPKEKDNIESIIQSLENQLEPYYKIHSEFIRLEKISAILNAIYKYGSFMATVVQAKSSDDVAKAIEAAALPAGSSRIKRETKFNISLNSYVGLFTGYEQIRGFDTSGFKLNSYGISAPIGIAISRGHSVFFIGTGKSGWSTSAFVSLVDIGAVAAFRIKDDSTSQVPTIQLQDIISPGIFLSIGIPRCPVSVNFGVQMGPNLRTVTSAVNDYANSIYLRYSLSLVVDIPIFNFYSKSR